MIFQTSMTMVHVNLPGCIWQSHGSKNSRLKLLPGFLFFPPGFLEKTNALRGWFLVTKAMAKDELPQQPGATSPGLDSESIWWFDD